MSKKRILCVEDHEDTCALISTILKNFEVVHSYSMADALRLATLEKFHLYLFDYHLPDGTGLELALLMKNFDTKTPILFITGTSSMSEKQAIKIGAQGLVKKGTPSFVEDLEIRVAEILEK
jgi:CheY-like chemotaxis protein